MLKNYDYAEKIFRKTFVTMLVLATFFVNSSAQVAVITSIPTELKIHKTKAGEKLKTTSYRLTHITKDVQTNELHRKVVCEFVPPDRHHCIEELYSIQDNMGEKKPSESNSGKVISYSEWIYIADKFFHRYGAKGKWGVLSAVKYDGYINIWMGEGRQERFGINTKLKYKSTPNQKVQNQQCDLYEIISTFQYLNQTFENYSEGFCFNKAGFVVSIYAKADPLRTTIDYEYDPNIKINTPLVEN